MAVKNIKRALRVVNGLVWLAAWYAVARWTGALGSWVGMAAESIIPIMLWGFMHLALRPDDPTG